MDNLFSVEGRVAIVTGASSGLGRRFAQVLHERGAHVVAAARRTAQLEALVAECPGVVPVTADMADGEQVQSIVAAALERFGRVDILVTTQATGRPRERSTSPWTTFGTCWRSTSSDCSISLERLLGK